MTSTRLLDHPEYVRFWAADTVSLVGTFVTTLALQVLAVVNLQASATELGVLLGLIPLLAAVGLLSMPVLIALVAVVGALSLAHDAAHQSYLPRLVPTPLLTEANARLAQTSSVAQTVGPMIAGWLVKAISAPWRSWSTRSPT
jgi:hypothetical protein